jgi:hypothetical protein
MPPKKCTRGKRLSKVEPAKGKARKCVKKRKTNPALIKWRKAAQAEGFMVKGEFKVLPKKGTPEYKRINARYEAM